MVPQRYGLTDRQTDGCTDRGDEYCDLPVWRLLVSAGLGRLMDSGGGSGGAASLGSEFQTAHRGFVLIFVFI